MDKCLLYFVDFSVIFLIGEFIYKIIKETISFQYKTNCCIFYQHNYHCYFTDLPVVQILSNYYSVEIGQSVTIQCTVTANPSHQSVRWQKITNGVTSNLDTSNNRYTGSTTGTPSLTISNVGNSDEGYYICTATNVVGRGQSSQTYLDVTGSKLISTLFYYYLYA